MTMFVKKYEPKGSVLDVGSSNVNGTYKSLFTDYTGLDMEAGDNVDIVAENPYAFPIADDSYDNVISGQTFEHSEFFWVTMQEMVRVCRKGGYIVVIAPAVWEEHRYPVDCYRFLTDGMIALARWCGLEVLHADFKVDAILIARKPYEGLKIVDLKEYKCVPTERDIKKKKLEDSFFFVQ